MSGTRFDLSTRPTPEEYALFEYTAAELDALPVGVITLDRRGFVLRYNSAEATYARRSVSSTLGRHFFNDIAPCTRVQAFAGAFETFAAVNSDGYLRFDFTFPFRWGHRDANIIFCRRRDVEAIDIVVTTKGRAALEIPQAPAAPLDRQRDQSRDRLRLAVHDAVWHDDLITGRATWSPECFALCELDPATTPRLGGPAAYASADDATRIDASVRTAIVARAAYGWEHRIVTAAGNERFIAVNATVTYDADGRAIAIDGYASDITKRRNRETELWRKANFDRLTGLANRSYFEAQLEAELADTRNIGRTIGIAYIDLDRFKSINDTFGHDVGDEVLRITARRLESCVRSGDLVARLSGDEFVAFVRAIDDDSVIDAVCQRIVASLASPIVTADRTLVVDASVGVALAPQHGTTVDDLVRAADIAMYESKASRTLHVVHFTELMQLERHERARFESDLLRAVTEQSFELYYQPIVTRGTHTVASCEALIRWNHPTRGLVMPDEFIGMAETNGAIIPIGAWVFESACARVRRSLDAGGPALSISVNVSLVQFRSAGIVDFAREAIARWQIPPELLVIELTESVASGNFYDTMRTLAEFKTIGVKLAIDDFGTGYSSLAYLKHFPIDVLKLDAAFVADIASDPLDRAIAETVVALARRLHLDVVAEGVETIEQVRCMEELGCDRLQGYYFGRPVREAVFFDGRPNVRG